MLRYTVNTKDAVQKRVRINAFGVDVDYSGSPNVSVFYDGGIIKNDDIVIFERHDGPSINIMESKSVVSSENGVARLYFPNFLSIKDFYVSEEERNYSFGLGPEKLFNALIITLDGQRHTIVKNRENDGRIANFIQFDVNYGDGKYEYPTFDRVCDGDVVLYADWLKYKVKDSSGNTYNPFDENNSDMLNITGVSIYVTAKWFRNHVNLDEGDGWSYDDEKKILELKGCIIPSSVDGTDNDRQIVWVGDERIKDILIKRHGQYTILYRDERFFYKSDNGEFRFKDGVSVYIDKSYIELNEGIGENFSLGLNIDDLVTKAIENEIDRQKNRIIDYEKQTFSPVYSLENGSMSDVSKIVFNLHFRYRDNEEWKANDNVYMEKDGGYYIWFDEEGKADLLGNLGFTDDDIHYQKKKVGKSFLRLSFYDSYSPTKQNLLMYSTIFLDGPSLYGKMSSLIRRNIQDRPLVMYDSEDNPLRASFTCTCKYDTASSSEGFYLYLFPSLLSTQECDDDGWAKIYMKAEFCHAKYGYTIPLIVRNGDLRKNYSEGEGENEHIDFGALNADLCHEVLIKYDESKNKYVWKDSAQQNDNGEISYQLYEPKINVGIHD